MTNMTYSTQNTGVRTISVGAYSRRPWLTFAAAGTSLALGVRNSSASAITTAPWPMPNQKNAAS